VRENKKQKNQGPRQQADDNWGKTRRDPSTRGYWSGSPLRKRGGNSLGSGNPSTTSTSAVNVLKGEKICLTIKERSRKPTKKKKSGMLISMEEQHLCEPDLAEGGMHGKQGKDKEGTFASFLSGYRTFNVTGG